MFVPFNTMSPGARLWIYQSSRALSAAETYSIANYLEAFTNRWAAHGQALKTSFEIKFNQFIILAADEDYNAASGCSIDESVRAMKQIEQDYGIQLFDRNLIAFKKGELISLIATSELKQKSMDGTWNEHTLTFNNLIAVKSQLDGEWIIPAGKTWLKRYLSPQKVTT